MSAEEPQKSKAEQFATDLIIGGTAGTISKTLVGPVERIKLLIATQTSDPDVVSGKIKRYGNIRDYSRRLYVEQGLKAFWRGNFVKCLRYAPERGSVLAFNDALNAAMPTSENFWASFGIKLLSGGLSGGIASTVCYPLSYHCTHIIGMSSTMADCLVKTLQAKGITGLYTGWSVTVAGAFVYRAGQLGCFKQIQDINLYKKDTGILGGASVFAAVTVARTVTIPFSYPFDTVPRRMMIQSEKPVEEHLYKGAFDCFGKVLKNEGLAGLYKGLVPELFRWCSCSGVGGSLVIVLYDRSKVVFGIA